MKHLESARTWITSSTVLVALGLPLFAEPSPQTVSGAQGLPRKQDPKVAFFRPGDVYGGSGYFGPNAPGAIFKLDLLSGSATVLTVLEPGGFGSMIDYDATLDRLVAWARLPGVSSNNNGNVLLFVDASGGYTYLDLPAQTALADLTCTGTGRTYLNFGYTVSYIDGMGPAATPGVVLDAAGQGPYSNTATLGGNLVDWVYDQGLNSLVTLYTTSAPACPGKTAAGIHVLPLLASGTQVAAAPAQTSTLLWNPTGPACDISFAGGSLSRMFNGAFMAGVYFQPTTTDPGVRFDTIAVDPLTLDLTLLPFASFSGCSWHKLDATGYSWKHALAFGSDSFHNFQPGGSHLFSQGSSGCGISIPGPYLGGGTRFVAIGP